MEYEWQEYPLGSPVSALCLSSKVNDNDDKKKPMYVIACCVDRVLSESLHSQNGGCVFFLPGPSCPPRQIGFHHGWCFEEASLLGL